VRAAVSIDIMGAWTVIRWEVSTIDVIHDVVTVLVEDNVRDVIQIATHQVNVAARVVMGAVSACRRPLYNGTTGLVGGIEEASVQINLAPPSFSRGIL
jgi:hypothetical protein